ncbi:hypothetical protein [Actinomadura atramentaria]|uniref:hypothetical protein n=1 Tax=Actinomadura atramentaria TaxID=1990 RepID=UPI00036BA07A|nr:hypothetical protein [Actinomadura atramentaria]
MIYIVSRAALERVDLRKDDHDMVLCCTKCQKYINEGEFTENALVEDGTDLDQLIRWGLFEHDCAGKTGDGPAIEISIEELWAAARAAAELVNENDIDMTPRGPLGPLSRDAIRKIWAAQEAEENDGQGVRLAV